MITLFVGKSMCMPVHCQLQVATDVSLGMNPRTHSHICFQERRHCTGVLSILTVAVVRGVACGYSHQIEGGALSSSLF